MAEPGTFDFFAEIDRRRKERTGRGGAVDFAAGLERRRQGQADQRPVGQQGVPPLTRAKISLLADTPEEAQAVIRKRLPQAEVARLPEMGDELFFRAAPGEQLRPVNPPGFEAGDIAAIAGGIPQLAGEAVGFGLTRGAGGLARIAATGLGGGLGEAARQAGQQAAGVQTDPISTQVRRIMGATGESLIGGTVGEGLTSGLNAIRRAGAIRVSPEAQAAIRAQQRLGAAPLLPHQVSDNPIIQRMGRQARAVSPAAARREITQDIELSAILRNMAGPERRRVIVDAQQAVARSNEFIKRMVRNPEVSPQRGGAAVQAGIEEWWKSSGNVVDDLYTAARSVEAPQINITSLQDAASTLKRGVRAARPAGEPVPVRDPFTGISTPGVAEAPGTIRASAKLEGDLSTVIDDILAVDPNLPDVNGVPGTEQLREFQKRLYDLTLTGPEGPRQPQALAKQLRGAIGEVLDNPQNTNPEFVSAWRVARKSAKGRFDTREASAVIQSARTDTPEVLARNYSKPLNSENLDALKRAMPPAQWRVFQDSAKSRVIEDGNLFGGGMNAYLDTFDKATRDRIFTLPEQIQLRKAARMVDRLQSTGVQRALQQQDRTKLFINDLVNRGDSRGVTNLRALIRTQGGPMSPFGKSARAALIDDVFDQVTQAVRGVDVIDERAIQGVLDKYARTGALQILTKGERAALRDVAVYQNFRAVSSGAGTSLLSAQIVAGASELDRGAINNLLKHVTIGRLMATPGIRQFLTGTGKVRQRPFNSLKMMAIAATTAATDLEKMFVEEP